MINHIRANDGEFLEEMRFAEDTIKAWRKTCYLLDEQIHHLGKLMDNNASIGLHFEQYLDARREAAAKEDAAETDTAPVVDLDKLSATEVRIANLQYPEQRAEWFKEGHQYAFRNKSHWRFHPYDTVD